MILSHEIVMELYGDEIISFKFVLISISFFFVSTDIILSTMPFSKQNLASNNKSCCNNSSNSSCLNFVRSLYISTIFSKYVSYKSNIFLN